MSPIKTASFVIILDFISGISLHVISAAVTFSIYKEQDEVIKSINFKPVSVRPMKKTDLDSCILLNLNQQISKCPVSSNTFGLIQLKMKTKFQEELKLEAWTRINLFSENDELNEGQWQIKMFNNPVQLHIDSKELLKLPQYNHSMLNYRIVSSLNSLTETVMDHMDSSKFSKPNSPSQNPITVEREIEETQINSNDEKSDITVELDEKPEFGFQVIRVKNIAVGDGLQFAKVRLSVYNTDGPKKGQVLLSSIGPVTCCTNSVRADFKMACYQFGRQIGQFDNLDLSVDCVVYAKFYLENKYDQSVTDTQQESNQMNESLIAWTAIPLVKPRRIAKKIPNHHTNNLKLLKINKGLHDIPFYEIPVIAPASINFDNKGLIIGQKLFGRAKLKLRIFHTKPVYESVTSSDEVSSDGNEKKNQPWIAIDRVDLLLLPYHQDDGIDLYIDSGRLWPDSVTVAKVEGRILNRSLISQGPKFSTYTLLSSDIFNPEFNERIEIRQPQLSPSSTLLLKIFTFDREERNFVILGFAVLKIFVETGTNQQPLFDNLGALVSLNDGGHQIRIYSSGPNETTFPFTESWFETNHIPPILGASILVRMYKAQKNAQGKPLNIHNTPKSHQISLGVVVNPPKYEDGYYYSMSCKPNEGERQILVEHIMRPKLTLRDLIKSRWGDKLKETVAIGDLCNANNVIKLFENVAITTFNMNRIAQYNATYGFKIAVDGCINIPWAGFSAALVTLFPPGALYMNKPLMIFDRPFLVSHLDLNSTPSTPTWKNGWKTYKRRKYDKYLIAILHIHEMNVKTIRNNYTFSLESEAWIPIQIFDFSYCITKAIQMPLIVGAPKLSHLNELKDKSVKQFLIDNLASKKIEYLGNASVIIRLCDSRRAFELTPSSDNLLTLDQSYIPESKLPAYQSVYSSNKEPNFTKMMPVELTEESFQQMLRIKFKNLIYKFYSENGFNLK